MNEGIINIAIRAARAAGDLIMKAHDRMDKVKVSEKNPGDYVTNIDQAAEQEIIKVIKKAYPKHSILGEEGGEVEGSDTIWIIDPIDGTRNFIHGLPHFAVSIAVTIKGKLEYGVIYDPVRQELFSAIRGKGAKLNDKKIRVSKLSKLEESLLGTGFPHRFSPMLKNAYLEGLHSLIPICGDLRRGGSAALDLAYVACGRLDGFWEIGLKVWDFAAGILLVKEAGGIIADFNGGETFMDNGNIIAANPKILKHMLQLLQPHLSGL